MRSLQLQAALSEFIEAAASYLHGEIVAGAEVPFELEPRGRRRASSGTALYCYRALTGDFLAARELQLTRLAGYKEAVRLLEGFDGLERYLGSVSIEVPRASGRARAAAAIAAILRDVFDEQTDFELRPERFRSALERLEQSAFASPSELTIVASLHGLLITSAELQLTQGLTIAQPDALEGLPDGVIAPPGGESGGHLVVVLALEQDNAHDGLGRGCEVLNDLLRSLRLFGDGRVGFGALAWARVGAGPWSPLALGSAGRRPGMLVVSAEQEDELRAFCNLVSRRAPHGNELAWALRRFERGCERESPYEGLTDHLLALRALLEPEGPSSGLLARRVAALCASQPQQAELTDRVLQAGALEREIISGGAVEHAGGQALAKDIADHLRALLRDVICGHLAADLLAVADELLVRADALPAEEGVQEHSTSEKGIDEEPSGEGVSGEVVSRERISGEQVLGDPRQAEEILDIFI